MIYLIYFSHWHLNHLLIQLWVVDKLSYNGPTCLKNPKSIDLLLFTR